MRDWGHPTGFLINILSVYNPAHVPRTQLPLSFVSFIIHCLNLEDPLHLTVKHDSGKPKTAAHVSRQSDPGEEHLYFSIIMRDYFYQSCLSFTTATPLGLC